MYAVIKTGGKQYRVKAGDMLIVEKLLGEPGAKVAFDQVLMLGDGAGVTIGAPLVADAVVSATLVETRKGEKIKVFKKTRRKGYRRTGGHRQTESVLRVTAIAGDGKSETWDGEVELTTRAEINARARNLAPRVTAEISTAVDAESQAKPAKSKAPAKAKAAPEAEVETVAVEAAAPAVVAEAPAKKKAAPKAEGEDALAKKPAAKKAKPAVGDDA